MNSPWKPQQTLQCHLMKNELDEKLEKFWEIDECVEIKHYSKEEEECEAHYRTHTQRDAEGKYILRLPFKENIKELGESFDNAKKQFFALERRLSKNEEMKRKYIKFMEEYEKLGHMELVKGKFNDGYFIPHHAVQKKIDDINKFRVVFNASKKTKTEPSLNDALLVGPTIQDPLFSIILRFGQHPIAFSGDIQKMYRQFWIHPQVESTKKFFGEQTRMNP